MDAVRRGTKVTPEDSEEEYLEKGKEDSNENVVVKENQRDKMIINYHLISYLLYQPKLRKKACQLDILLPVLMAPSLRVVFKMLKVS